MLVQFSFKNFASFKDEVTFDMTAIKSYKEHEYNLIDIDRKEKYLKLAAIYGANSSGKSNFIKAYLYFSNIIKYSFTNEGEEDQTALKKYYNPFLFQENIDKNTEFEVVGSNGKEEYKYGFIYNDKEIVYEWLYKTDLETNRQTTVFERNKESSYFTASIKSTCSKYASEIEDNVLYLSFFYKLNLRTKIFKTIHKTIVPDLILQGEFDIDRVSEQLLKTVLKGLLRQDQNGDFKKQLLSFIKAVDLNITDIFMKGKGDNEKIYLNHVGDGKKGYSSLIDIASTGTKKIIILYLTIVSNILRETFLLIDELDAKLHPLLTKLIVTMIHEQNHNAQLIYTTHDTTLLDKKYLRRDQVWFVSKDEADCSKLYSLAEFKTRRDSSYNKEYLGGAYGAIPIIEDFELEEVAINGK